ncbi:MAG: hypothetical protein JF585_02755 [Burkholderiales bacterium]|nr:hypothetical protein [Burkholderiales bacterium]
MPDVRELPHQVGTSENRCGLVGLRHLAFYRRLLGRRLGRIVNDDVERKLFGPIDAQTAKAVQALLDGDESGMHDGFQNFFEHLTSQLLRTPKGLDWIRSRYAPLDQVQLMVEMQALRFMHRTMWAEGVREMVSAEDSDVKFIVTDHPVTIYNAAAAPGTPRCVYTGEPAVHWLGTQTVYALDAWRSANAAGSCPRRSALLRCVSRRAGWN